MWFILIQILNIKKFSHVSYTFEVLNTDDRYTDTDKKLALPMPYLHK